MNAAAKALADNFVLGKYHQSHSFSKESLLCAFLFILSFLSAVMVIYFKDNNRHMINELQSLQREETRLQVEWGQLLLEEGSLKTHARIQQMASTELKMFSPTHQHTTLIEVP
jgi:cell division protein FtsL